MNCYRMTNRLIVIDRIAAVATVCGERGENSRKEVLYSPRPLRYATPNKEQDCNKVKKEKHIQTVLWASAIVSICILFYAFTQRPVQRTARYSAVVFSVSNGWGYDILVDDSVFIHQESIPGYGNGKTFPEKEQAEKAANLVLKKLKSNEGLPTLTRFELQKICPSLK